ncbi:MAG: hypothetical protein KR126chlam2_00878, partial [Chlamydiae bacterium]|nr:hypothetical protein [Chlamydiota bacterium]
LLQSTPGPHPLATTKHPYPTYDRIPRTVPHTHGELYTIRNRKRERLVLSLLFMALSLGTLEAELAVHIKRLFIGITGF